MKEPKGLPRTAGLPQDRRKAIARKAAFRRYGNKGFCNGVEQFTGQLIAEYYTEFRDYPDLFVGLVEPLILWAYEQQVLEAQKELAAKAALSGEVYLPPEFLEALTEIPEGEGQQ